ncbi:MAG: RNA methyltransferase [Pseudonocardiales bacterium]|nr:MAG: RNA methyltransferase [Pseudonocardiales bacterium]
MSRPAATVRPEPLGTGRTPRVAAARKLTRPAGRTAAGRFLAEGPQAVREALRRALTRAPGSVLDLFGTVTALGRHGDLGDMARDAGVRVTPVTDEAAAGLSETVTPQGIVAVCARLDVALAEVLSGVGAAPPRLVAVLAEIRDPGNAGTVLRTAGAIGAGAVVFAGDSVDPYNGKCVRASAGSLFHLPIVSGVPVAAAVASLRGAGLQILAADADGETDLEDLSAAGALARPTAWVFGNEARGLPESVAMSADSRVAIALPGQAESLNLAAAAAICLYASARTT